MITVKITAKNFTPDTRTESDETITELDEGTWNVQYIAETPNGNYVSPYTLRGTRDANEAEMQAAIAELYAQ